MPRITNPEYLNIRRHLRQHWLERSWRWSHLKFGEQHSLHLCFRPAENLSDSNALEHRRVATAADPSLPQRAGWALRTFRSLTKSVPVNVPPKDRRIVVRPVLRPEIDLAMLSRALLDLARHDLEGAVTPAPMDDEVRRQHLEALIEQSRRRSRTDDSDEQDSSPPRRAA